jgi:peptidoglycan/xylan/chitin deacetylase (PgdA/CDA1 family)
MRRCSLLALAAVAIAVAGGARVAPAQDGPTELQKLVWRGQPVYCGEGSRRWVALTFDDGPGPYTLRLTSTLRRLHARATFFLVGNRIATWPDAARADAAAGALGNHTWSHPHLPRLAHARVFRELQWTQVAIVGATHKVPALFRPPYEQANAKVDGVARQLNMVDVRWDVDARDAFPGATEASTVRNVLAAVRPGSIVLMHDAHPWTADAAAAIVRALRARRLKTVTAATLLDRDPPHVGSACLARPHRRPHE